MADTLSGLERLARNCMIGNRRYVTRISPAKLLALIARLREAEAEREQLRDVVGAHVQADAYRDSFPDDEQDAEYNKQQETWWRLIGSGWLDDALGHKCAEAAKARAHAEKQDGK